MNTRNTLRMEREAFAATLVGLVEDGDLDRDKAVEVLDRLGLEAPTTEVEVTVELNVELTLGGSVTTTVEVPWGTDDDDVLDLLDEDDLAEELLSVNGVSRWDAEVTNVDVDRDSVNVER